MILDGKSYSKEIISDLQDFYLNNPTNRKFAIISVGDDYGSRVYCNMKKNTAAKIGIDCEIFHFGNIFQTELEKIIKQLAKDDNYAGIMIQHPLPKYLNEQELFDLIPATKDVDGLSTNSIGRILTNTKQFVPATALGIVNLLKHYNIDLVGKKVLVIGRSQIVGLPLANMFIKESSTVTVAHSRTENLQDIIKDFDIVVAAIGKPEYLKADWFKEGQILVDAGYNSGNVGDIEHLAYEKASYYTPVPGGVGPMTVASLMQQLSEAVQILEKTQKKVKKIEKNDKKSKNLLKFLKEKLFVSKKEKVKTEQKQSVCNCKSCQQKNKMLGKYQDLTKDENTLD